MEPTSMKPIRRVSARKYQQAAKMTGRKSGLGDLVHAVANPVAKIIDMIAGTNIQNCGGCKKRRRKLNMVFPFKVR